MSQLISADGRVGLAHETFTLVLDKVIEYDGTGPTSLTNKYDYTWNFVKDEGLSHLDTVDGNGDLPLPLTLHPAGIKGTISFLGSAKDQPIILPNGWKTTIYRAWLILDLATGQRSASVMLGKDGKTILATQNYDSEKPEIKEGLRTTEH